MRGWIYIVNSALLDMIPTMGAHATEIARGDRFAFGENWSRFLERISPERIESAEQTLKSMLGRPNLHGLSFLDIGSGSGLFSLAARRLGARVFSFDFDPKSVACTAELRRRYFADDPDWRIEEGSALDEAYVASLGRFDIVYSWGVLHHTGNMWKGLENAAMAVAPRGLLFIALYNDQGGVSRRWTTIKRLYCRVPLMRGPLLALSFLRLYSGSMLRGLLRGHPLKPIREYDTRGMSCGMIWSIGSADILSKSREQVKFLNFFTSAASSFASWSARIRWGATSSFLKRPTSICPRSSESV